MGYFPTIAKKLGNRRESAVPEAYKDELLMEMLNVNVKREIVLACALIIIITTILTIILVSPYSQIESMYVSFSSYHLHILLLFGSLVFLMITLGYRDIIFKDIFFLKLTHILIISFVLILCSIIAVNNELAGQRPFSYLTAALCIGSVIIMPPFERGLIYTLSWVFYQIGMIFLVRDPMAISQNFIFVTMLLALALIISDINYSAYISGFMNRKTIEEYSKELDRLYKIAEDSLLKRTEELNQAKELEKIRTAFFTNISHELRTPLNVIFTSEQMLECALKSTQLHGYNKEIPQYMEIMKQNCYRLTRLIDNLIDMTKIDAEYLQYNPEYCNIVKVVEDISLSAAIYIERKNICLTFDTDIEEKFILCDPEKIERIVLNLLSNAVKFTHEGGHVDVSVYDGKDSITISVRDTGIGIPEEMTKVIFDRFVQVDKSSTRDREGSGIGLSLTKSLVEMHGGSISVKSKLGEGSEFVVEFPVIQSCHENSCAACEFLCQSQKMEKIRKEFSDIYD
ncbi:MAG TPA: HAMP domain-containing sensor histidine kinase [Clostridia bacterium]|nr:HAMP domain-containing sensor histidine kinase [Clostridia bacterium]